MPILTHEESLYVVYNLDHTQIQHWDKQKNMGQRMTSRTNSHLLSKVLITSRVWHTFSCATFDYLRELISPALIQMTNYRKPIEPSRRLAIVLLWYATLGEYCTISCLFGVVISTVCTLVTAALVKTLYHRFIFMLYEQFLDDTFKCFKKREYPQCARAIDGTRIPVIAPRDNPAQTTTTEKAGIQLFYRLYLTTISVSQMFTLAHLVVHMMPQFFPILTSTKLQKSNTMAGFFPREARIYLFKKKSKIIQEMEFPVRIIGNTAYPLRRWLMKGYTQHHQLSPDQILFTHTLTSARMVVENAFG
ncbi:uncharacterized protein LOC142144441 [Mixophyes fleayi]|uniref:uncharacterized protein LOC142144441 n=1 Tax=Mixophyes fleayi TaxID=3061075 RepID=UPI003F4DF605